MSTNRVTNLKWNTKKNLKSMRRKLEHIAWLWGDTDYLIVGDMDDMIAKIDEVLENIDSMDPRKF